MLMRITMVECSFNFLKRSGIFYLERDKKFGVKSYIEEAAVKKERHDGLEFLYWYNIRKENVPKQFKYLNILRRLQFRYQFRKQLKIDYIVWS